MPTLGQLTNCTQPHAEWIVRCMGHPVVSTALHWNPRSSMAQDPHWHPVSTARPRMSVAWWQWVASRDSLTHRLIQAAGEHPFRVQLLNEGSDQPHHDESMALLLPSERRTWVREVALCVDDTPWVVARSIAPLGSRHAAPFRGLGETSLGSWLFRQPDLERGPIEICHAPRPIHGHTGLWQRRSVFRHSGWSVLVQEAFMPQMAEALGLPR